MNQAIDKFEILEGWKKQEHKIVLWIGRAKLPHIGHIAFLKALWEKGYKLVIGNGSCYTLNKNNPIHVFQVQAMLALSLRLEGIPIDDFIFVPIPDFEQDEPWREYVFNIPNFDLIDAIATDNPRVTEALGKRVDNLEKVGREIVKNPIDISATRLREAIRDNEVEIWNTYAAEGTKIFIANSGDFYTITNAVLGKEVNYEPGRQCVDVFMFVFDGFEWNVVLGNRRPGKDFANMLATVGGGIDDYESPIDSVSRELFEESNIRMEIITHHTIPAQVKIDKMAAHLYFVDMFSTPDEDLAGSQGGSSLAFMTIYDGSIRSLKYLIKSKSDLLNVRPVPVAKALEQGLAYQQTEMLEKAFRMLEGIRRQQ